MRFASLMPSPSPGGEGGTPEGFDSMRRWLALVSIAPTSRTAGSVSRLPQTHDGDLFWLLLCWIHLEKYFFPRQHLRPPRLNSKRRSRDRPRAIFENQGPKP